MKNFFNFRNLKQVIQMFGGFIPLNICTQYHKDKGNEYHCNTVMTFDTETTTVFKYPSGIWDRYHYCFDSKNYDKKQNFFTVDYNTLDVHTLVYLWTFSIYTDKWDVTFYGRTNEDFKNFISELKEQIEMQERREVILYIYVHNLAFDFTNSLENIFIFKKVFARKSHKVIYCETDSNIVFRCSYFLSNSSLANVSKENKKYKKITSFSDYNEVRTPSTDISDVLEYACFDTLSLAEYIERERKYYKYIYKIPLTSTGKLRRAVKEANTGNVKAYNRDKASVPSLEMYEILLKVFQGGDCHANSLYVGDDVEDVDSFDRRSSYPAVMISKKYPCEPFFEENPNDWEEYLNNSEYCSIGLYEFTEINFKKILPYIKSSKCEVIKRCRYDNGRVFKAEYVKIWLTDVDVVQVKKCYRIKTVRCERLFTSHKAYLTDVERMFILECYWDKTTLKGIEPEKENYMRKKNYINALFGREVQRPVDIETTFDNKSGEWEEKEPTTEEIEKRLEYLRKNNKMTMYARGVYVTAYARQELLRGIEIFGENHIYNDTDSSKGILTPDILKKFYLLNKKLIEELREACSSPEMFKKCFPRDSKGRYQILGTWEHETYRSKYDKFKTFGSKKYLDSRQGNFEMTISGLSKKASDNYSYEDVKIGTLFKSDKSGRTLAIYQTEQPQANIQGYISEQKRSLSIQPTTYRLGYSDEYFDFLQIITRKDGNI